MRVRGDDVVHIGQTDHVPDQVRGLQLAGEDLDHAQGVRGEDGLFFKGDDKELVVAEDLLELFIELLVRVVLQGEVVHVVHGLDKGGEGAEGDGHEQGEGEEEPWMAGDGRGESVNR